MHTEGNRQQQQSDEGTHLDWMLCWLNGAYGVCQKGSDSFLTELSQDVTGSCPMTHVLIARAPKACTTSVLVLMASNTRRGVVLNKA